MFKNFNSFITFIEAGSNSVLSDIRGLIFGFSVSSFFSVKYTFFGLIYLCSAMLTLSPWENKRLTHRLFLRLIFQTFFVQCDWLWQWVSVAPQRYLVYQLWSSNQTLLLCTLYQPWDNPKGKITYLSKTLVN